ncbi:family 78 glycoside hydrolase catalytic domain [Samsonia erythrinae]|uniref:Alpha-L-rhamnosidase-like protein n=1 Tax=Samsonia erythrinae TaxID=160434 RepID=A0A4R3VNE4_9GAMM|nr:family 78 glycoside hydrolase catalytic domain [Samsonia erythrinae]TCV08515.1 alpha-L-rhamnosidase-like protein [Samsonia erythrinae]
MTQMMQHCAGLKTKRNEAFLAIAESLRPDLYCEIRHPVGLIETVADAQELHGWKAVQAGEKEDIYQQVIKPGEEFIVDLGTHCVGYITLSFESVGSPPDAPAHVQLIFGETLAEMAEPFSEYQGWLSSSWLQQEDIYIDVLPATLSLSRRYCCRYVKVRVISTSPKFNLRLRDIHIQHVSSADMTSLLPLMTQDSLLKRIDDVSVLTLHNCMQDVFEDGPKRDRRLWLGDLRLQAQVAYYTFEGSADLVKRCLYLFAGVTREDGLVSANLFMKPDVIPDDTFLFDYSLFFVSTLHDYVQVTQDLSTLADLWPTAYRQIELALEHVDDRGIIQDQDYWWSFVDWHDALNKQASSQGIFIYVLSHAINLARLIDREKIIFLEKVQDELKANALKILWDEEKKFFISGKEKQISFASQVWLILSEVGDKEFRKKLIERLYNYPPEIKLRTPYMMHHFIDALMQEGEVERAIMEIKRYWGGMIKLGADTFWELFDPDNLNHSPYGSKIINSYCHAWSCTPAYFIRKYSL